MDFDEDWQVEKKYDSLQEILSLEIMHTECIFRSAVLSDNTNMVCATKQQPQKKLSSSEIT